MVERNRSAFAVAQLCATATCALALVASAPSCFSDSGDGAPPDAALRDQAAGFDVATGADTSASLDTGGSSDTSASVDSTSPADTGSPADAASEIACDGALPQLPDLTRGQWLICNALDTGGRIWEGVLTITSETPTCDGAALSGTFAWVTTNLGTDQGNTLCQGSYVAATRTITLNEYQVEAGSVTTATDTMTYDPASDQLVNGSWTCGCNAGQWSVAVREDRDAGGVCQAADAAAE
jgi:hypothetical protein